MSKLSRREVRCLSLVAAAAGAFAVSSGARAAAADYAPPPESPYRGDERGERVREERPAPWDPERAATRSMFRLHVGPAMLLEPMSPGLLTALDVGRGAVGARVWASWLRAESERGLACYSAELWVDLLHRQELHPVLGAGASVLRGRALGQGASAGAGVLRGALEYELPLAEADARLSLNFIALVPAIASERTRPWLVGGLMIGAGF